MVKGRCAQEFVPGSGDSHLLHWRLVAVPKLTSASAVNGTAFVANYAGTKAYNLILGESLWYELRSQGVDVVGFMPGPTRTPG